MGNQYNIDPTHDWNYGNIENSHSERFLFVLFC